MNHKKHMIYVIILEHPPYYSILIIKLDFILTNSIPLDHLTLNLKSSIDFLYVFELLILGVVKEIVLVDYQ